MFLARCSCTSPTRIRRINGLGGKPTRFLHRTIAHMTFLTDKEELKPGLVIFRRGDVQHRNWYCRVKLPKTDRYKTISLKTADVASARDRAYDHAADLRFRTKHAVPIFNHSFSQIAKEYVEQQKRRAATGQVSDARWPKCQSVINARLCRLDPDPSDQSRPLGRLSGL